MMWRICFAVALTVIGVSNASTHETDTALPSVNNGLERATPIADLRHTGVGERVQDFTLSDLRGNHRSLKALLDSHRAIALVLREVTCPIAMKYGPSLARLERELAQQSVGMAFINFSEIDTTATMSDEAKNYGFAGPYLIDRERVIISQFRPKTSTEVFLIDSAQTLRYRGAVDDQYGIGYQLAEPNHRYLRDAVDAVLDNRYVTIAATTAPGCAVELDATHALGSSDDSEITWHDRISRIVQAKCMMCHRMEGAAPFPLEQFESVRGRRAMIRRVVEQRIMPPWGPAPIADGHPNPWLNDMSLSERDRQAILDWIDGGCEEGDPANAPVAIQWPTGWEIGEPDAVIITPETFHVPAEGVVDYQYFYIKSDFEEDRWISAMEVRPAQPQLVHHVLVFIEEPQRAGESDRAFRKRQEGGLNGYFARMSPGAIVTKFETGFGKRLPAGAWLKFQVHYTPNGTAASDRIQMGFQFLDAPPRHEVNTAAIFNMELNIPPHAAAHVERKSRELPAGITIAGLTPHMHLRGKSFRYELEYPNGRRVVVCDVPRFDFNWQMTYRLAKPIHLAEGGTLHCTAVYDNSSTNAANPNPTARVRFGQQTTDEMMIGYYDWWR